MFDRRIWDSIGNKKSCSFKLNTKADILCKNEYNVAGICSEFTCPLANTKYATVRTIGDELFLFVKEPERCQSPKNLYEQIKLSDDYEEALNEIEQHLEFWDKELIHKCKQKMTKLYEYLERLKEFEQNGMPKYMIRKTKMNRREKIRALRALNTVNFEKQIGEELMARLESGIYGEENKTKYERAKEILDKKKRKRFVADFEESNTVEDKQKKSKKTKEKKKEIMEW